ncbi:hypothetical protein Bca52824_036395 [Brassica carinata]|uniref:DUF4283 domain-containing protein n=1 Tax=Brassica carinata TaxID=52824 RepID=A0A8X7S564_BRACI|nr:hypothetical protein Bca52824_036395 [Brassica carinata]
MSRRYSREEKAKGPITSQPLGGPKRIRAPELDTSALIQANSLTLIGRVTNPQEQSICALIANLPKKWSLSGSVSGSDLGHDCFQFRFELEEDLRTVLANRPYHFCYWMVILQRWEPTISRSFPSHLPFWIRLKGLPLHYWHHKMIYKIGHELGTLEDYEISSTSARMRLLVDGLQPLTVETIIEYISGEESLVTLDYEGLENHCSLCFRLTHLRAECPYDLITMSTTAATTSPTPQRQTLQKPPPSQIISVAPRTQLAPPVVDVENNFPAEVEPFDSRVDRHGNPFGERVSTRASFVQPLRNKITPQQETSRDERPRDQMRHMSPPYTRSREPRRPRREEVPHRFPRRSGLEKRRYSPERHRKNLESDNHCPLDEEPPTRPPVERNLNLVDFPPPPPPLRVPSTDEVMEELRECSPATKSSRWRSSWHDGEDCS